jgi:hypothetical protein
MKKDIKMVSLTPLTDLQIRTIKGGLAEPNACSGGCKKMCITGQVSVPK